MAKTISITGQKIENQGSPKRDNVYLTSAIIHYGCSASWYGSDTTSDPGVPNTAPGVRYTSKWNVYDSTFTYTWTINGGTFTGNNINATITELTQGAKNSITASVTVKGSYTPKSQNYTRRWVDTSHYDPDPDENGKKPGEEGYSGRYIEDGYYTSWVKSGDEQSDTSKEVTATADCTAIDVWTRPGNFTQFNFSQGTIIQSRDGLTAEKVGKWIAHCNAYVHWYEQDDSNNPANSCAVSAGDIITADWYNNCCQAIPEENNRPPAVKGMSTDGENATIISADIINALGEAISKEDDDS